MVAFKLIAAAAVGAGVLGSYLILHDGKCGAGSLPFQSNKTVVEPTKKTPLPTREKQMETIREHGEYDVLIIGGGATGSGCALDACTRGLKTCLLEANDFASGTSSRSTKLVHGGVRYLQKAIMNLDSEQYKIVKESLRERAFMLNNAPHLAHPLPIMLPVYTWWQIPYYWVGIKMYDLVAGRKAVKSSYFISKKRALELFPMLRGDQLTGAIVYYDGQFDDARMNVAIALTAARHGATVLNHVKVIDFIKDPKEVPQKSVFCQKAPCDKPDVIRGVRVKDQLTGEEYDVMAKAIINATGPFTDLIRKMDDPETAEICAPSSGTHVVLPGYYSPAKMGLLDPDTSDGRVIFFLPWQKHTIAGTTDLPCELTFNPKPTEAEILFILDEIKHYLNKDVEVRRADVLSAWSGIRPLVSDPNKPNTQSIARNHIIHVSPTKLVTVAGGKWTTYRAMAEETVDVAIKACNLRPLRKCQTNHVLIEGAHGWSPTMYIRLVQDLGLETDVALHLSKAYGDRAFAVAKLAKPTGQRWPIIGRRIHPELPYITAEVRYGCREYARTAVDMIGRRLRLAFLNAQAAEEALPEIIRIMAEELSWSEEEQEHQRQDAMVFLGNEMGHYISAASRKIITVNLTESEIEMYTEQFKAIDKENKGFISIVDARKTFKDKEIHGPELHKIISAIDTKMHGQLDLDEYLQMMSAIKSHSINKAVRDPSAWQPNEDKIKKKVTVERASGDV